MSTPTGTNHSKDTSAQATGRATERGKVQIGNTSVHVYPVCFGTSALGNMPDTYGYGVDEEQAKATIRSILDSDFPFIDASRNYGFGRSEERVGTTIQELGGLPDGAVISTKLDRDMDTDVFNAARARESLEESLTALGVDHVDILHLHDPEYATSLDDIRSAEGALNELFKIKSEGLADAVGLAAGRTDIMMPLLRDWDFDVLITHNRYTLINRHAEPMIELAQSRGISIINAAPYAGGVFAKGTTNHPRYVYQTANDTMLAPVRQVESICAKYDIPPGAAALQFSMRDPRIASTICGVSRPERVEQTLAWADWPIPEQAWEELLALPVSTDDPEATRDYKPG